MKAVVLAAGKGTRLEPLTSTRQKTMIPIAGHPILYHVLSAIKSFGIREVIIVVKEFRDQVMDYFGDGSRIGMSIKYVDQKKCLGTGHALKMVADQIKDSFLLMNGDIIFDHSFMEELRKFRGKNTIVGKKVADPSEYGVLKLRKGRFVDMIEKPPKNRAPSNMINTGIYLFEPEIFDLLKKVRKSRRGEIELPDAIRKLDRVEVAKLDGYYRDIGRPWDLLEANEFVMKKITKEIRGEVEESVTIRGDVVIGKGTVITGNVYIRGPVYIGENCEIGPNCYIRDNVNISDNVGIGRAVEVKNSIILEGSKAEHLAYIGDSLIGANCNFGAGTKVANLRFDDRSVPMVIRGKKVESKRRKLGVVMGDNCKTGINSCLMPGVKIGPEAWIGPGAVIYEDVKPGTTILVKQNLQVKRSRKNKKGEFLHG